MHRLLRAHRHGRIDETRREEIDEELPEVARHTSERERRADDAERELLQWRKVRFMADKVGDEFDGYITGVAAFGLFIELVEHFVEGLVHISSMADDYYRYLESSHTLHGENTHKVYRLGDKVRVQLIRVDLERRQIDLGLTEILDALREGEDRRGPAHEQGQAEGRAAAGEEQVAARQARARGEEGRAASRQEVSARVTHVVVGTAGHIDHGKSTLVRALTGIDPDRLKEEKARGITIDLGFAHWRRGDLNVAFVDVPGHERFVKNMLAGVGGIDAVLLVVAADEGVMPQTREHLDICRLLAVPRGIVVITKADLVDADMLELVQLDVAELVTGTALSTAPVIPVSATSGLGIDALKDALESLAAAIPARDQRRARAPAGGPRVLDERVRHGRHRDAHQRPSGRRRHARSDAGRASREGPRPPGAWRAAAGGGGGRARGGEPQRRRGRRPRARSGAGLAGHVAGHDRSSTSS